MGATSTRTILRTGADTERATTAPRGHPRVGSDPSEDAGPGTL